VELLAATGRDGKIRGIEDLADNIRFLNEITIVSKNKGISLKDLDELDKKLEKVAKALGMSKSDIRNLSMTELDQIINEKGEAGISLDEEDDSKEQKEANKDTLKGLGANAKQEINLDKRIDSKHTLADVMGLPAGSKLIVVYSDKIKDRQNTTRFSCLIEGPDGSFEIPETLKQVGGKDSDKEIYQVNNDGSKVEKTGAQSSFAIDSPIVENAIINIRIGSMGYPVVNYGEMSKTDHHKAFTQELETHRTHPVRSNVRKEFNQEHGDRNATDNIKEADNYIESGCGDHLTLEEADGDLNTRTWAFRKNGSKYLR